MLIVLMVVKMNVNTVYTIVSSIFSYLHLYYIYCLCYSRWGAMDSPRVIIVLLNFNSAADTIECIESLEQATYPNFGMLIADNASTDDSAAVLRKRFPSIPLFVNAHNAGYTGGINFGIREARKENPDFVLVLNNDTVVEPGFLEPMVEAMEADPEAAACGGLIIAEHDRRTIWYAGGRLIPLRGLAVHLEKGKPAESYTETGVRETSFITGCLVLYRTSALDTIGPEDERFFMYLDDIELSARISRAGFKMLYVPEAVIYHKVLGEKENPMKLYYSVRNRLLLISEMNSGATRLIAKGYFLTVICLKLITWYFSKPEFVAAATAGLQDYFKGSFGKGRGLSLFYGGKQKK